MGIEPVVHELDQILVSQFRFAHQGEAIVAEPMVDTLPAWVRDEIELIRSAIAGESAKFAQGDLDVACPQLDRVVQVAILAAVPDLDGPAVTRSLLSDAHAFRVVAVSPEWRCSRGSDPLVASLVAAILLLQPFTQGFHEFVESAHRFYLCEFFLAKHGDGRPRTLGPSARRELELREWKGNARELENTIERALALSDGSELDVSDLPQGPEGSVEAELPTSDSLARMAREETPLKELEDRYIDAVLEHTQGNRVQAARILGIDRKTLYRRQRQREEEAAD